MPLLGMGRVEATAATSDAIRKWNPRYVVLVGIAGGVAGRGVRLGDVLVSSQEEELRAPEPKGNRVVRKLAEAAEILTRSAEAVQSLGRVGVQVIRLAPIAATLWQIAHRLWGGG